MGTIILLIVLAIIVLYFVGVYNGLITSRNGYKNAFAQIDVQLTRRHDLIPNLVETAKGYLKHERETLEAVVKARTAAVSGLADAKTNPGDPEAMKKLAGTENRVAFSRQAFNDAVLTYNNRREVFPSSFVANMFNFQAAQMLEIEDPKKREVPTVSFS